MSSPVITSVLIVAVSFVVLAFGFAVPAWHLPGNQQGYEPVQPIAFSHRLHAGELNIACLHCHAGAETSRHAGIPAASTCMSCHRVVSAPFVSVQAEDALAQKENRTPQRIVSAELKKLYDFLALKMNSKQELVAAAGPPPSPVPWVKVYHLPDFAYFDHRAHVNAGVACQRCHGPVETMDRLRQVGDLSMGWCVHCHRGVNNEGLNGKRVHASTDCATCHY